MLGEQSQLARVERTFRGPPTQSSSGCSYISLIMLGKESFTFKERALEPLSHSHLAEPNIHSTYKEICEVELLYMAENTQ